MSAETKALWLRASAIRLDSVDPANINYADLEPFRAELDGVRVVLLGEIMHGDGSSFTAKTRLVQWLHQHLGFDALAFESGFYDCHIAWQSMQTKPAREAFREGVFAVWSRSAEIVPLVTYLGDRVHSAQPLELMGFDCQLTGTASETRLIDDLEQLRIIVGLGLEDWSVYCQEIQKLVNCEWREVKPSSDCVAKVQLIHRQLLDAVDAHPPFTNQAFWKQCLHSLQAEFLNQWVDNGEVQPFWNQRDSQMAENLLWHLERNPARRLIVWAANLHIARNAATITQDGEYPYRGWIPMGQHLHEALGAEMLSVAITGLQGEMAICWDSEFYKFDTPHPSDLETFCDQAGLENAIFSWRKSNAFGSMEFPAKFCGTQSSSADWTNVFDAVLYTRDITRSHLYKQ